MIKEIFNHAKIKANYKDSSYIVLMVMV